MAAIGPPLVPASPTGDLGELQRRVLGTVAWCHDRASRGLGPAVDPEDPCQAQCVADGLRILLAALPTATGAPPGTEPAGATDTPALLARAGEALDRLAEASRRAAVAFAVVGHECAADLADSLMTVAVGLRMLVEIAGRGAHT